MRVCIQAKSRAHSPPPWATDGHQLMHLPRCCCLDLAPQKRPLWSTGPVRHTGQATSKTSFPLFAKKTSESDEYDVDRFQTHSLM